MPREPASDEELSELVRTLGKLDAKRTAAKNLGTRGLRLGAIDLEILQVEEEIRRHCLETNLRVPRGVAELSPA
jgi:hypothetical protein